MPHSWLVDRERDYRCAMPTPALRLVLLVPLLLLACGGSTDVPDPHVIVPDPVPPTDDAPRPSVPPADAGGWSDPGPRTATDPCPTDMAHVPAGAFTSGATRDQVAAPPDWPDDEFLPRTRHERRTGAYCIDLYEYPNVAGELPWVYVAWLAAKQACASRGRRLCTEDEWARACGGDSGLLFPYGDIHEPKRCNDTVDPVGDESQKSGGGAFPDCVGQWGVYDMDGNVSEWVDAVHELNPERSRIVRGGTMWVAVYGHGCMSRHSHHQGGPTHGDDGFRCCMDPLGPGSTP